LNRHLAPIVVVLALVPSWAFSESLPSILSRCDGSFFHKLHEQRDEFKAHAPMGVEGKAGYFKVPDQRHETASRVMFTKPISTNGLAIVGFFDEIMEDPKMGAFYSWGLLIQSSVQEAAQKLRTEVWEVSRLRIEEGAFVRSEVWRTAQPQKGWTREVTESGPPKPGTVERVLLIEPYNGETAFIRFGCSIQGEVTTAMLRELRPDLGQ
jgi:hypothetical protein